MPYFNLESGAGGLIVAIGWSGDWKAALLRRDDGSIHVTAGLKQAHFRLLIQGKRPGKPFLLGSVVLGPVNFGLLAFSGEVSYERTGAGLA